MEIRTDLFLGDSKNELKKISDDSVDKARLTPLHENDFTELNKIAYDPPHLGIGNE